MEPAPKAYAPEGRKARRIRAERRKTKRDWRDMRGGLRGLKREIRGFCVISVSVSKVLERTFPVPLFCLILSVVMIECK